MSSKRPSLAESMRQVVAAPEPAPVPAATPKPAAAAPPAPPAAPKEPPARAGGFFAATRVGKKKVTAALEPIDKKRLSQLALELDRTNEALMTEAISDLFAKYGKPGIGQGTGAA